MVKIYISTYNYSGKDRLDITVKGQDPIGKIFAPTWCMVKGLEDYGNEISYIRQYYNLMRRSYRMYTEEWTEILNQDSVTFVCFCKPKTFCHRYLLVEYFVKLGGEYIGEV